ncbi:SIMPL domain-containing protein [Gillisia sp. M10.2A]|uniref:SIMPL domain-containing protein n=1 Tax=Gillisia lutea TaxID=2909668 RepID=A0ABS9EMB5_9FLAO|nr:SIMPL domain-containing protein [Gillisia lutea]MCF4102633.1 SIMPL domain-containing protein [Gillisia lutea]
MKSILLLFAALGTFAVQAQQIPTPPPTVNVTGEGIVKVAPDQVTIKSRIEHEGKDVQEVKRKNDNTVNSIIKYLKSQGIAEKNIQTDYLNLNKNYNYNDKTYSYVANQAISIKLEDLKNYEKIMSGLLEAGLNRIDGIQFKSSEMEKHKTEARRKAVLNAKRKALEYVNPLGQNIGKAVSISEIETSNYQPVYRMEMMKASDAGGSQETIAPGELEVSVKVNIGFLLE